MPSINLCIDLNNNKTDSTSQTSTCEHLRPLQCAEMYPEVDAGTIAAILDLNESRTNAPHSSGQKRQKRANPPYWGLKELPIW